MPRVLAGLVLGVALALPAACSGGVVGGACREGLVPCHGSCAVSCDETGGAAGTSAEGGAGHAGASGSAGGRVDGSPDALADGTAGTGDSGDAATDGGVDSGCRAPFDNPSQCGDCETRCNDAAPLCAPVGASFACVPLCAEGLLECGEACIDPNSSAKHCGRCFNACATGLCQGGTCVGANVGHIVVSCINYRQAAQTSPQTVLLGNTIFLPLRSTVRILAFAQYAVPSVKSRLDTVIGWAGAARGRTYSITDISGPTQVITNLSILDYDVFLIHDQPNAPPGVLAEYGGSWRATLDAFSRAGGVILALSGGVGVQEMDLLLTNAGLLDVEGELDATGATLYNHAPADAIGVNVLSPFLAVRDTCTFSMSTPPDSQTVFVIGNAPFGEASARPVVVHRVRAP
jgi:hypothetical protein